MTKKILIFLICIGIIISSTSLLITQEKANLDENATIKFSDHQHLTPEKIIRLKLTTSDDNLSYYIVGFAVINSKVIYIVNAFVPQSNSCKYSLVLAYDMVNNSTKELHRILYEGESSGITYVTSSEKYLYWLEETSNLTLRYFDLSHNDIVNVKTFSRDISIPYLMVVNNELYWPEISKNKIVKLNGLSNQLIESKDHLKEIDPSIKISNSHDSFFYKNLYDKSTKVRMINAKTNIEVNYDLGLEFVEITGNENYLVWTTKQYGGYVMAYDIHHQKTIKLMALSNVDSLKQLKMIPNSDEAILEFNSYSDQTIPVQSHVIIKVDIKNRIGEYIFTENEGLNSELTWYEEDGNTFAVLGVNGEVYSIHLFETKQ